MRSLLLLFTLNLLFLDLSAQVTDTSARWTWMSGVTSNNSRGSGVLGVEGPYSPPAKRDHAMWVDTAGYVWIFGGEFNTGTNCMNDLWRFNPSNRQWTWVKGLFDPVGNGGFQKGANYGTRGVAAPTNLPGGRRLSNYWKDDKGKFWIFGGIGYVTNAVQGYLNDLWTYDPATNNWTWVSGDNIINSLGLYGTKGVGTATTRPGGRLGSAAWVDKTGRLWVFGGLCNLSGTTVTGRKSDLWMYDPKADVWTWMMGPSDTGVVGSYGTIKVPDPSNYPGARSDAAHWVANDGSFWMFGGYGLDSKGDIGRLNDLWRFDPDKMEWTWMHGSNICQQNGVYGIKGVPDPANTPGSRNANNKGWVDVTGCLWLMGGYGLPAAPSATMGYMEDIWKYDPNTGQWTWMMGRNNTVNAQCVPGTIAVSSPTNYPGSRGLAPTALDLNGNIWLSGGLGYVGTSGNSRNDLWSLVGTAAPIPAQPGLFTSAKSPVCAGETGLIYSIPTVTGATSYEWKYTGSNVTFTATTTNPTNTLNFATNASTGTLSVRAVNSTGPGPWRDSVITVNPVPTVNISPTGTQTICAGSSVTLSSSASLGVSYQWKNGTSNVGTNSSSYAATAQGSYTLTITNNTTGCSGTSAATQVNVTPLPTITINPASVTICAGESATLTASGATTYSWSPAGGTAASATVTPGTTTTYTVTGTTSGCSSTATRTVTVNPLPVVNVTNTGARSICDGDSLLLTASSGGSVNYQWKNGTSNVGTGANYYAKAAGTYTVTVTNTSTNCAVTSSPATVLTVNPVPNASIAAGGPTDICVGSVVSLTATPVSGAAYQWLHNGNAVGTNANNYDAAATGAYQVKVSYTGTGCAATSAAIDVTVHNRPSVRLLPGDTAFCEGGILKLEVETSDTALSFSWLNNGNVIPLASADFLEISATGVYKVEVGRSAISGCDTATNEVTVTVHPLPVVNTTWDGATLHATQGFSSYQWYSAGQPIPGATNDTYAPQSEGGFSVTAIDSNGCSNSSPVYNVKLGLNNLTVTGASINIYPNPTSGMLFVDAQQPVNIRVSGADGRTLREVMQVKEINLEELPSGMYFIQLSNAKNENIGVFRVSKF